MTTKTKGGQKAPRSHRAHWKDSTSAERQQKRLDAKNEIARAAGYKSWSSYETAVINKIIAIAPNPP